MIHGWTNGAFGNAWIGADGASIKQLWFCFDLGTTAHIQSIHLIPSGHDTKEAFKSKEYEILLSDSPPSTSSGTFTDASVGFQRFVHATPGDATAQMYEHQISQSARYIMFHAL